MAERQQFNVTLPPALVRKIKYRAIDAQLSASHLVERLLEAQLARKDADMTDRDEHSFTLQPMVHVADMPSAVSFYEALGAQVVHGSRDGDYVLLDVAGAALALLAHPPSPEQDQGPVELQFTAHGDLRALEQKLRMAGVDIGRAATDEAFGAQLHLRSPDGLLVKVNQLEPDLYT